jgi:predicted DNA-binding transcriptional regulator AlpA
VRPANPDDLLTLEEVAAELGLSAPQVRRRARAGVFPNQVRPHSQLVLVPRSDLDAHKQELRAELLAKAEALR